MRASHADTQRAIVVGAGVSGCACAAVLAEAGIDVLLLGAALDVAGMPAYGPVVSATGTDGPSRLTAAFDGLPRDLRCAWLADALVAPDWMAGGTDEGGQDGRGDGTWYGSGGLLVDPRTVSLRVKWVLEQLPTLRLRQGLATGLERNNQGMWTVHTAFGDVLRGSHVVLAVGLAMRGRLTVGRQEMDGGRYGEVAADQLCDSLAGLGVRLSDSWSGVGPSFVGRWHRDTQRGRRWLDWRTEELEAVLGGGESGGARETRAAVDLQEEPCGCVSWPSIVVRWSRECRDWLGALKSAERVPATSLDYSPAVGGVGRASLALARDCEGGAQSGNHAQLRVLVPSSTTSWEWQEYCVRRGEPYDRVAADEGAPGECGERVSACSLADVPPPDVVGDAYMSRPGYGVSACFVSGAGHTGRLVGLPNVWAIGRVSGVRSYVGSLLSGIEAAREIVGELGGTTDLGGTAVGTGARRGA